MAHLLVGGGLTNAGERAFGQPASDARADLRSKQLLKFSLSALKERRVPITLFVKLDLHEPIEDLDAVRVRRSAIVAAAEQKREPNGHPEGLHLVNRTRMGGDSERMGLP